MPATQTSRPRSSPTDRARQEPNPAKRNVQTVAHKERQAFGQMSTSDRVSAAISHFAGSLTFVGLHVVWFAAWMSWNLGFIPGLEPFDPFPFGLLTMMVSLEAVLVSTFVLITQNWMNRQAERRAHLDLQVSILAEQEMTLMLQLLHRIADRVGVPSGADEVQQYVDLDVEQLADELDEHLSENQ